MGVVSIDLTLEDVDHGICHWENRSKDNEDLILQLDDGSAISTNKQTLVNKCPVFAAMLGGSFSESDKSCILLPQTSFSALHSLLHYLHGCRVCTELISLPVCTLLELVSLADKYLLEEFNLFASQTLLRRCLVGPELVEVYRTCLQKHYPVGLKEWE